ncbi:NitT/TauT family transport system substrate-binding protein [Bacillus oleivorans]|uniref:NitT/TauT family transport system substrate-binding protein n=1 Tax=Bacillus oleivorans TaxID=1448271 RepID=A0A285CUT4_9BACI|nr:ABC transporter substrate-binding protein [Bacillus oleivorans]SNX70693.1 NitT/TauT family transport system substrate-binding protein [Bacillus oleivorans]
MKKLGLTLFSILIVLVLAACGASEAGDNAGREEGSAKEPLKVTLPTWTGYGPLFLAQEKGFFEKHGIEVELSIIEGLAERKQALAGGQVDGMATALDVQVTMAAADVPMEVVWLLDDSYGGDGITVKNNIHSVEDLKGKQVAFEQGSTSHLLLLTALEEAGLTDQDVEMVQMSAGDAGAAFVAGQVDAAVTWEPWLSKASEADGKILVSTKDLPGIIVDTVGFRKSVVEERPEDIQAFVNAMADAMDYWKENEEESNQIMAEGLNIDVEEFTATVTGLKFMDAQANKNLFGTSKQQGDIYSSAQNASDFYLEQGLIEIAPSADEVLNSTFVEGL